MIIIHVLHIAFISTRLLFITISGLPRRDGPEWCLETEGTVPHNGHTFKEKEGQQGCNTRLSRGLTHSGK